jgi:hypothetical protein
VIQAESGIGEMQAATLEREQLRPAYAAEPLPGALPLGEPVSRKARRTVRTAILWGALGFFSGAIFWHAVGFWTFVSGAILNRGGDVAFAREVAAAQPELPVIYLIDPASCTALELDRTANRTAVRPCPREGLALRLEASGDREDLAVLTREAEQAAGYPAH